MDHISGRMMRGSNCSMSSTTSTQSSDEDEILMNHMELRRGPWTVEEDELLINYIVNHGEGRWNSLAQSAGLKRTGKSCRLRWLNYLRPDVRRGNITPEEQLMILELHSRWGNRWSKIAQYLPGRTDNEIKNYWRTRVQKHAKQLRCDVNSKLFKDTMRYIWMPRLAEKIRAAETTLSCTTTTTTTTTTNTHDHVMNNNNNLDHFMTPPGDLAVVPLNSHTDDFAGARVNPSCSSFNNCHNNNENCSTTTAASSDSFGTTLQQQVSPVSDLTTDHYQNNYPPSQEPNYNAHLNYSDSSLISPSGYFNYHGLNHPFQGSTTYDQQMNNNNVWSGASTDDLWDNLWTPEDTWFLQQQF